MVLAVSRCTAGIHGGMDESASDARRGKLRANKTAGPISGIWVPFEGRSGSQFAGSCLKSERRTDEEGHPSPPEAGDGGVARLHIADSRSLRFSSAAKSQRR